MRTNSTSNILGIRETLSFREEQYEDEISAFLMFRQAPNLGGWRNIRKNAIITKEWSVISNVRRNNSGQFITQRRQRAGEMGRQRSEEARQLISQKSKDSAKAVFERNSSAGQMNFRRSSSTSVPPPPQVSLVPGAVGLSYVLRSGPFPFSIIPHAIGSKIGHYS